jgi:hypothetical protein
MKTPDTLTRREFTLEWALAVLGGAAITITGCGGGSSPAGPSNPPPGGGSGDKNGAISANHGHTAVVTAAQLTAGNALNVELTVGNGHTHVLALSAAEVVSIAGNQRVSKQSSQGGGHDHTVTFN